MQEDCVRRAIEDGISLLMVHDETVRKLRIGKVLPIDAGINPQRLMFLVLVGNNDEFGHSREINDVLEMNLWRPIEEIFA